MNVLSLFSGIGGLDLAAEWAGMTTVAFCERDKFCQRVLAKHWPGVRCFDDVTTLTGSDIDEPVDLITGGFPCQPYSLAGKQLGRDDDRHLWPEYRRLIKELWPTWVVGENVVGIVNLELDNVLADLEGLGYAARPFDIPAAAVGAHHERRRIAIVANHREKRAERHLKEAIHRQSALQGGKDGRRFAPLLRRSDLPYPGICRSLNGIPNGLDRVGACGNAVMPQHFYPIFKAIADIEARAA